MPKIKIPSGNDLFWIVLIAFLVSLIAIYLSNNNEQVSKLTDNGWF